MTTTYFSANDLGLALRLKDLLGSERVALLRPDQHPLGAGFRALRKRLVGREALTHQELQQLGNLLLVGRAVDSTRDQWEPHRYTFSRDLSNAGRCAAILFELHVIEFALQGKVEGIRWSRFDSGAPDLTCARPELAIECKLITTANLDRIFDRIEEAWEQHRERCDRPFVIAVGFEQNLPREVAGAIYDECRTRGTWFEQRPEISAVLIFEPHDSPEGLLDELGVPRRRVVQGTMHEVKINNSRYPLPIGFTFGR